MKRFILSDLHIGHPDAQYDVMEKVIGYISQNYETGDEIWGLGDWFHINDGIGFDNCLAYPAAKKFGELAAKIPTKLIPGNHDGDLEDYQEGRKLPAIISSISIVNPFMSDGIWYCHGHEYDPSLWPLTFLGMLTSWLPHKKQTTPGTVKSEVISEQYLKAVQPVQVFALLDAKDKEGCKGIVFGHTHLPLYQESPDSGVPFLLNDGDMRGSSTFVVNKDNKFQFITWNPEQQDWKITLIPAMQ